MEEIFFSPQKILKQSFAWFIVSNRFVFHIVVYVKQKPRVKRHLEQVKHCPAAVYFVKSF